MGKIVYLEKKINDSYYLDLELTKEQIEEAKQRLEIDDDLDDYFMKNKTFNPTIDLPFMDMVLDKNKRKCVYAKYDKKYESNPEEDEIFREMTRRRRGKW